MQWTIIVVYHADALIEPTVTLFLSFFRISNKEGHLCQHCGKFYEYRRSYLHHIRKHEKNIEYTCEICDKTFTTSIGLKQHMTLHQNVKPYLCSKCGKSFR